MQPDGNRGDAEYCHHAAITLLRRGCSELSGHCPQADSSPRLTMVVGAARRAVVDGSGRDERRRDAPPPRCPGPRRTSRRSTRRSRRSARSRRPWPRRSSRPPSSTTSTTRPSRTSRTRRARCRRSPPISSTRARRSNVDRKLVAADAVPGLHLRHARDRVRVLLLDVGDHERGPQPVHEPDRRQPDQGRDRAAAIRDAPAGPRGGAAGRGGAGPVARPRRRSRWRRPTNKRRRRRRRP